DVDAAAAVGVHPAPTYQRRTGRGVGGAREVAADRAVSDRDLVIRSNPAAVCDRVSGRVCGDGRLVVGDLAVLHRELAVREDAAALSGYWHPTRGVVRRNGLIVRDDRVGEGEVLCADVDPASGRGDAGSRLGGLVAGDDRVGQGQAPTALEDA